MRLYRATYKDRTGTTRESAKWYLEMRDDGRVCRLPAFTDKAASAELGRKIDRLRACRASGEAPDVALTRWLETLPTTMRETLVRFGLLEARRVAASKRLADHLADFGAALAAKGGTADHVDLVVSRVGRVVKGCGFKFWSDVNASKVQRFIAGLRADRVDEKGRMVERGIGAQTSNYYLAGVKAFAKWMVRDGRASESPLVHLSGINARADRRHDRRALAVDELRRLLGAAQNGPERAGMSGPDRAALYLLAVETGLRAAELRSLTRGSFNLGGAEPTVTVRAGYSKRRREDVQPLRPETAALLRDFLAAKAPAALAFPMPKPDRIVSMLRADLEAARRAWLAEAATAVERGEREARDFLAYRDAAGRVADFHALRHTFISNLASGGVHPKTAQSLARHSTITLTMDRYSHTMRGAEAAALAVLPDLSGDRREPMRATGTDGRNDAGLSWCAAGRILPDSGGISADSGGLRTGAPRGVGGNAQTPKNIGLDAGNKGADDGSSHTGRSGGTGRRDGLKIRWG